VEREKVERGVYVYQEGKEKKRNGQEERDRERKIEVLRFIPREGKKRRERGAVRERELERVREREREGESVREREVGERGVGEKEREKEVLRFIPREGKKRREREGQ
jgi:hypothetical protein